MSRVLRLGLLALLVVSLAACAPRPKLVDSASLAGAWRSNVQFSDGVLAAIKNLQFLTVFNSGGTMTEFSNHDAVPPVALAYGEWRETAPRHFGAKYAFFTTSPPADMKVLAIGSGWLPAGPA